MTSDVNIVTKYSDMLAFDSTKKLTRKQQFKSFFGSVDHTKIINSVKKALKQQNASSKPPPSLSKYNFFHFKSLTENNINTPKKIKELKKECQETQKISNACLKKMQKMPEDKEAKAVFERMETRSKQVEQQLTRMEHLLELKKKKPALAAQMEQAYNDGNYFLGDQIYAISKDSRIAQYLTGILPNASQDPSIKEFFNNLVILSSSKKTLDLVKKTAQNGKLDPLVKQLAKSLVVNPKEPFEKESDEKIGNEMQLKIDLGEILAKLISKGKTKEAMQIFDQFYKSDDQTIVLLNKANKHLLSEIVKNWKEQTQTETFDVRIGNLKNISIDKDKNMQVDFDGFYQRPEIEVFVGKTVVKTNDSKKTENERESTIVTMHESLHKELNELTDASLGLSDNQQLRLTEEVIKLASINGLARIATSRKEKLFKGKKELELTAGHKLPPKTTVSLENVNIGDGVVRDGTVIVRGPIVVEELREDLCSEDSPRFYGVQVEARISIADLKQEPPLDPLPWTVESRVTKLHNTLEELMSELS